MKNQYKVNKDLIMSWAEERVIHGTANKVLFALWCIVGALGIGILVAQFTRGGDVTDLYFAIFMIVLSLYKLTISHRVVWMRRYKFLVRSYGVEEWIRTVEFTLDDIVVTDHTSVCKIRYKDIVKIKEKGNFVLLLVHPNMAIRLYKDAFVEGDWEKCKLMIDLLKN